MILLDTTLSSVIHQQQHHYELTQPSTILQNLTTETLTTLTSTLQPSAISEHSLSHSSTEISDSVYVFTMTTWTVTMLVGAVGNVLLCLTIFLNTSLHTAMNTYVFSIGMVDLVTCLGLLPLRVAVEAAAHSGRGASDSAMDFEFFLRVFTDVLRLLLLLSLTLERYQAIAYPFAVTKTQARRRAKIVIGIHSVLSLVAAALAVSFLCDSTLHHHCRAMMTHTTAATTTMTPSHTSPTTTTTRHNCNTTSTTPNTTSTTASMSHNHSNTSNIAESFEILSIEWGLLETYIELPLTLITVMIIISSYTFILTISKQQNKKFSTNKKTNNNNNNATKNNSGKSNKTKRTKRNQVSPAPDMDIGENVQRPSVISTKEMVDHRYTSGSSGGNTFLDIIVPPSSYIKEIESRKLHEKNETTTDTSIISQSLSEIDRRKNSVTYRKYSLPDEVCSLNKKGENSEMNLYSKKPEDSGPLRVLTLFDETQTTYDKRESTEGTEISYTSVENYKHNQTLEGVRGETSKYNKTTFKNDDLEKPAITKNTSSNSDQPGVFSEIVDKKQDVNINDDAMFDVTSTTQSSQNPAGDQNQINAVVTTTTKTIDVYEMDGTKHTQEIPAIKSNSNDNTNNKTMDGAVCLMTNKNRLLGRRRVELKAAFKVVFIFGCFVCFWMPLPVSITIMRAFVISKRHRTAMNMTAILSSLATSTAAMDPIVYGLLNQHIVEGLVNLKKTFRRRITTFWT